VALAPFASVAVTVTVKLPEFAYVWVAGLEEDVPPSPKVQLNVKAPTPPVALAVKVTGEVASGDVGL